MKKVVVVIGILLVVIGIGVGVFFFTSKDGKSNDTADTDVVETEQSTETSTEVETAETVTTEYVEVEETNVIEEVNLTPDFKFDVSRSEGFLYASEIEEDEDIMDPFVVEMYTIKQQEQTGGYMYLSSDHVDSYTSNGGIRFDGKHSLFSAIVTEEDPNLTTAELRFNVSRKTPFDVFMQDYHDIPYGTPFTLNKGFSEEDEAKFFPDKQYYINKNAWYIVPEYRQVIFEDTIETRLGLLTTIGWWDNIQEAYFFAGYMKAEDGRSWTVTGSDITTDYFIAYLSDIFDNCMAMQGSVNANVTVNETVQE